jgi:hypothetical protein
MEHQIKRGFGPSHVKEYFVVEADGDTMGSVITGPFESEAQCSLAIEALRPICFRPLRVIGGHLVSYRL